MSTPYEIEIPPLEANEQRELMRQWDIASTKLMERNGDDANLPDGGHRIKSNPLLRAAIYEIRDEYYTLLNEQRHLNNLLAEAERPRIIGAIEQRLDDLEYDLINQNRACFYRLQNPDYGFSPEQKAEILAQEPDQHPNPVYHLSLDSSYRLLRSIIGCTRESFLSAIESDPNIPRHYDHEPEQANYNRHTPNDDGRMQQLRTWIEYVESPKNDGEKLRQ
jgi:hypothetical protein